MNTQTVVLLNHFHATNMFHKYVPVDKDNHFTTEALSVIQIESCLSTLPPYNPLAQT
jgi:uncharacterized SAM-dependent methyltransferase